MPFNFNLTIDERISPPGPVPTDLAGEDIRLPMSITPAGDLATVTGVACAKQSAIREGVANPGSFPRRPDWGVGIAGMLFKGATNAVRDRAVSRLRARLLVNPRIVKVHDVTGKIADTGMQMAFRADAKGGALDEVFVVRPPGVS